MPLPQVPGTAREALAYGARARKFSRQILEVELTNAVNGGAQDIVLGNLPEGAVLSPARNLKLNAQFTGGGATSVGLTIGTAAAPALVAASFNIFGGAASGLFVAMAQGAQRVVPVGGQTLIARITPDGAHNLAGLTAGSLVLEVYFALPESRFA
jgi:hypothetical protein